MAELFSTNRRLSRYAYIIVAVLWMAYVMLTVFDPHPSLGRFHLSGANTFLLDTSILVPVLAVWLLAAQGVIRFRAYARLIQNSHEGPSFSLICNGLVLLLAYLISLGLLGAIVPFFEDSPFLNTVIVLKNHLPAITSLLAFIYIYLGSVRLSRIPGLTISATSKLVPTALFLVAATAFTIAFSVSPTETLVQDNGIRLYAVSQNLLLFTLVLPYLCAWLLGLHAALNIADYARGVKGKIYRQALKGLVKGIIATIIFTVVLQLFYVATPIISNLNLGSFLAIIYVIVFLYGLGAYYISAGSKRLAFIEVAK